MTKKQISMVTLALLLGNTMAGLDGTIINTALPAIISDLNAINYMGWMIAIFLLGQSVTIPLWTKIGEKISFKNAFETSLLLFLLGSIFEGISTNIFFFLIARLIMGIGAGGMGSLPYVIAGYLYPNIKKRTQILGYLTACFNGAAIIGPLIGGWLIDIASWHWVFYINVPIGIVTIILSLIFYKDTSKRNPAKFDFSGAILMSIGLITFLTGLQMIDTAKPVVSISLTLAGIFIIAMFLWHEHLTQNAIIPIHLFKNRNLNGDFLIFVFTWGAYIAVNTYMPMWAQSLLGLSALVGGMTLIPNSIVEIITAQLVSTIREHLRIFYIVLIGLIAIIISTAGMALLNINSSIYLLTFIGTFSGIGVGLIIVSLQIKVQTDAGIKDMATATSLAYLLRTLSQTITAAIYGIIMNVVLNRGVSKHPSITLNMMNKLTDNTSAKLLPKSLLPTMKSIFHSGLQGIMLTALLMLIVSVILNFVFNFKKTGK